MTHIYIYLYILKKKGEQLRSINLNPNYIDRGDDILRPQKVFKGLINLVDIALIATYTTGLVTIS